MVIEKLLATVGLQWDKKSARNAQNGIDQIKSAMIKLAGYLATGLAVKKLVNLTTETARLGDEVAKTSEKLGVNAQALQELRHAAELTGIPVRTMDMALQRFTRRAAEAAKGTGEAKDALRQMGVRLKDNQGRLRPTQELLGDVADAMSKTKSSGERLRLAFKLFDSEGAALVNTLKGGRAELNAMMQEARDLGGVMDDELLQLSEDYTDATTRQSKALQGVKNMIARQLLPFMIRGRKAVIEWIKANREWLRANIIGAVEKTARVVKSLVEVVRMFAIGLREAWREADPTQKMLLKIAAAAAVLALILTSPVLTLLAIAAAVGLVYEDFKVWERGGSSAIGRLDEKLGGFLSAIRDGEADIFNLGVAWKYWKNVGGDALDWVVEKFKVAGDWWGWFFKHYFYEVPVEWIAKMVNKFLAYIEESAIGQFVARTSGAIGTLAGGGSLSDAIGVLGGEGTTAFAPVGSPAGAGPSVSMAGGNLNVTVNNAQGMDEKKLADNIGEKIARENDRMLRNAAASYQVSGASF